MITYHLALQSKTSPVGVKRALEDERQHHEAQTVARWASVLGVRMEWLTTGEGPMIETRPKRLRDREEWRAVEAQVRRAHRELHSKDVSAIGDLPDVGWPARLDAPLVATLAAARRAWLDRSTEPSDS